MKKLINNKYANFYLNAASKLGFNYEILNEKVGLARIFNESNELFISSNVLSVNLQISASLAVNKVKTSILLREKKIPVPSFKTFADSEKAEDYASKLLQKGKFVVVKPITGSLSIGITVNPSNRLQIKKAVTEAFIGNSSIMIEEYVYGRHYRITVLDDEVMAVTERIPAYVTGDGKSSVFQLIEEKNVLRKRVNMPAIFLRKKDLYYLKREKIELSKIYPLGVSITLQLGCDLDIGGERLRINRELIPTENLDLFTRASKTLNLRFAGIDYITPDILTPYTLIPTAINEINSAPDSDVHYRDTYPHNNYAAERILEKLFNPLAVSSLLPIPTGAVLSESLQIN